MKPSYLEAFYNVCKYGGISEASQKMPLRPSKSSISTLITNLENYLGLTLFERRPFKLTPKGQKLYDHCHAFFSKLPELEKELREETERLSVGAPEVVLNDYLEKPIDAVKEQFPQAELSLVDGDQASLEEMLQKQEIDVAATIFDTKPADDLCALPLLELPLALVVPAKSKWKSAEDFWKSKPTEQFLLLPPKHAITRNFRDGLKERGIHKISVFEADTTGLIEKYVLKGYGIGVSVAVPGREKKGLRFLPLKDFTPVTFGLLWQQSPTALVTAFIEAVKASSRKLLTTDEHR